MKYFLFIQLISRKKFKTVTYFSFIEFLKNHKEEEEKESEWFKMIYN